MAMLINHNAFFAFHHLLVPSNTISFEFEILKHSASRDNSSEAIATYYPPVLHFERWRVIRIRKGRRNNLLSNFMICLWLTELSIIYAD